MTRVTPLVSAATTVLRAARYVRSGPVFLIDIGDRAKINDVRRKYFGSTRPASTLVEVSALAVPGMLVEIEAVVDLSG